MAVLQQGPSDGASSAVGKAPLQICARSAASKNEDVMCVHAVCAGACV